MAAPALSVVVPVFNEEDNVAPLVGEIVAALRGKVDFEIVYVDDQGRDIVLLVVDGHDDRKHDRQSCLRSRSSTPSSASRLA